jgi:hypothetical protein
VKKREKKGEGYSLTISSADPPKTNPTLPPFHSGQADSTAQSGQKPSLHMSAFIGGGGSIIHKLDNLHMDNWEFTVYRNNLPPRATYIKSKEWKRSINSMKENTHHQLIQNSRGMRNSEFLSWVTQINI